MKKPRKQKVKKDKKSKRLNLKKIRRRLIIVAVLLTVFMLLGGYKLVRQAYYSFTIKRVHSAEFSKLQDPLKLFGFENTSSPKPACSFQKQYGASDEQLLCVTTADTYTEIGKEDARTKEFVIKAKELDQQLSANGWKTQSNSAKSFEEWVQAVSLGTDFNTDINATKEGEGFSCILIMTVAYSNPSPPAVNVVTSCNAPTYPVATSGAIISN